MAHPVWKTINRIPVSFEKIQLIRWNENSVTTIRTPENNGRSDGGFVFQFHLAELAVALFVHIKT